MIHSRTRTHRTISYVTFTFLLALYFALIVNIPIYKELYSIFNQLDGVKIGFVLSIPIFFLAALNFLFNLFSWPGISKPFFIILLFMSSVVSYAAYNYGTFFDYGMITNIVETDTSEASSYLSAYSLTWILLMGGLPALWVFFMRLSNQGSWLKFTLMKLASMIVSVLIVIAIAALYYQDYASVGRNHSYLKKMIIPTEFVSSAVKYVNKNYLTTPEPYRTVGSDAKQSQQALQAAKTKPTLLFVVVGETARTQNYQLNNYSRATNQYTIAQNVISFQDVSSCGTATAVSLPCMFSELTHNTYDHAHAMNQDNVLDILRHAGINIMWKDNDGGDKGVARNVLYKAVDRTQKNTLCDGSTCYDMSLLEGLDQDISNLKGNRIIALHLMGSHGPTYYKRYPKNHAKFLPDCERADIENCSIEQIVNTYDNTILYTDYVLNQLINKLKALETQYNTALIYVSDHGESLGENGLFLHGMPYSLAPDFQKKVPFILWMSPGFEKEKQIDTACLKQEAQQKGKFSHDNLFHSLLGIMDVKTTAYQPALDLFQTCRQP
ncbi:phosphoethanolamine--lipid A transferase [Vibrio sinensis]|uniref:Phosphoethanolamine--lipid A transferase n=1 Tax=Vibrio sinensis TaxID=2302434 RepID=A0A3A6QKY8_9VIBR|nr:phosphoethanolamine--lipid A transferase [Vibrio sinensis]RJX70988.1 phosphoethanolamine--lipid A transferase [Vibrio sinensis]